MRMQACKVPWNMVLPTFVGPPIIHQLLCSTNNEGDFLVIETIPSGTVLYGRYRIEHVLGSGGFGHVYLAVDIVNSQQSAVKEYLVSGPSGQEQLQHEANVLSQLHHPNLPAFHDAFNERGRYYIVLNYIEGHDLTDIIRMARQRNEVVPLAQVMGWILAVCDAVYFLHSQHPPVIHRDIKPDNIRIMPNNTAVLVDLGNAKAAADGARTLFFIRHQGTPGYAPQEQYPGGGGTNESSDVYALGGTLYFALTTHEPPSVSTRNQSIQQGRPDLPSLQEQLANNPPENDSEANARQFRLGVTKPTKPAPRHIRHIAQLGQLSPELLQQLNRIIRKAMAMKQKDRYQTVADFAGELKKVAAALPQSVALPPSRPVDPHSTQPDLPMLYESMQAAKAESNQGHNDWSAQGGSVSPGAPSALQCPRCSAPLTPQAVFCPRCGTALSGMPQGYVSSTTNPSALVVHKTVHGPTHKQGLVEPSSAKRQAVQGFATYTPSAATSAPSTSAPGKPGISPLSPARPVAQTIIRATPDSLPQSADIDKTYQARGGSPSFLSSLTLGPKTLILMGTLVVVLLLIMLFLLTHH
jgi:serine/threonine protein kinase